MADAPVSHRPALGYHRARGHPVRSMTRATPPLSLTREAILGDSLRALVQAADPEARCLSPEEHKASLQAALDARPERGDVWLFGYGSLIWNPLIHFVEK